MSTIVEVSSLSVRAGRQELISQLSFTLQAGARLGLIGESGAGKSLTALALLGLLPRQLEVSGSIRLDGVEVVGAPESNLVPLRGSAASVVFQEPLTALDPLMRVGRQVAESILRRAVRERKRLSKREVTAEVEQTLEQVSLPGTRRIMRAYPFELSGGQRQRVAIAMAIACRPKLLIADEPTTALDVTTQAEIIALLDRLVRERGMALLFIGHDLPVVAQVAERVIVLKEGAEVARGELSTLLTTATDAYTRGLIDAARRLESALEDPQ